MKTYIHYFTVLSLSFCSSAFSADETDFEKLNERIVDQEGVGPTIVQPDYGIQKYLKPADMGKCDRQNVVTVGAEGLLSTVTQMVADGYAANGKNYLKSVLTKGKALDDNSPCPAAGESPDGISCQLVRAQGKDYIDRLVGQAMSNGDAYACQMLKTKKVQGKLSCFRQEMAQLNAQMAMLQQVFVQNATRMQQEMQMIVEVEQERAAQYQETQYILNGDERTSKPGLIAVRDQTREMVAGLPQILNAMENGTGTGDGNAPVGYLNIEKERKILEEGIQTREALLTNQCFSSRPSSSFLCTKNGAPVAAKDYLLCRYEQNLNLNKSGQIIDNALTKQQAKSKAAKLNGLLNEIFGDAPAAGEEGISGGLNVLSWEDVDKVYGARLKAMDSNGIPVYAFVKARMEKCGARARRQIKRERSRQSTSVGAQEFRIKKMENAFRDQMKSHFNTYSQHFGEINRALYDQHLPLDTRGCDNQAPRIQVACLKNIQEQMEGVLNGTTANSLSNISIKGNDVTKVPPITLNCQGMNGCINDLTRISRGVEKEVIRLGQLKNNYAVQAKVNMETAAQQAAQALSPYSQLLKSRMDEIDGLLGSMGFTPIALEGVEPEELRMTEGEPSLPLPPQDIARFIGGRASPPLLNANGGSLQVSLAKLADETKEAETKLNAEMQVAKNLQAEAATCLNEGIAQLTEDYMENRCNYATKICKKNGLDKLADDLHGIIGPGIESGGTSALSGSEICMEESEVTPKTSAAIEKELDGAFNDCMKELQSDVRCNGKVDRLREKLLSQNKEITPSKSCHAISRNLAKDTRRYNSILGKSSRSRSGR